VATGTEEFHTRISSEEINTKGKAFREAHLTMEKIADIALTRALDISGKSSEKLDR